MVDEVEQAAVGPLKILEEQDGRALRGDPLEEDAPCREQDVATSGGRRLEPEEREEGRLDPAPIIRVGNEVGNRRGDPLAGRGLVVRLGQSCPATDHLAQRPEGDALAVRGRATTVPVDRLEDAIEVLLELPGQPALADPARSGHRHEPRLAVASGRAYEILQQAQLFVAAHEWRFRHVRAALSTALGHDPQGAPGGDGARLALEDLLPGLFERDRRRRQAMGRLTDEHGSGRGSALEPGGGVDQVARDHPLPCRAEGDGGFAGEDAGSCADGRTQDADGADEIQSGAHRALGVVLAGGRRTPEGHDGVADEFLDRPAVAFDDVTSDLEVPAEGLADFLGVALLGERGEPDEIGEQDRHEPALGEGWRSRARTRGRRGTSS